MTASRWPSLPVEQWQGTRDSLQLYTQVVGKVVLAHSPVVNHWWNSTLHITSRGLMTSLVPHPSGTAFQFEFDFISSTLRITTTSGDERAVALAARPVADFYTEVMKALDQLGVSTEIWPMPVEIPEVVPFPQDRGHITYDAGDARRFWLALVEVERVFAVFRSRFVGKSSPVHVFWGALDLAVTRFSGRPAPRFPRGAPNCGPQVMTEAYSHEVSSAGYWPGGDGEGVFYSYAYPEPDGFREFPLSADGGFYSEELGEFVLPYDFVRTARDPDALLLAFLQSSYEAAAVSASWDRAALERPREGGAS